MRRKADPAKENVREFMAKWKDNDKVSWHPSHDEFVGEYNGWAGKWSRGVMAKWKDSDKVSWHPSHDEFVGEWD